MSADNEKVKQIIKDTISVMREAQSKTGQSMTEILEQMRAGVTRMAGDMMLIIQNVHPDVAKLIDWSDITPEITAGAAEGAARAVMRRICDDPAVIDEIVASIRPSMIESQRVLHSGKMDSICAKLDEKDGRRPPHVDIRGGK